MRLPFRSTPQSTNVDVAPVDEGANPVPKLVFREFYPAQIVPEDLQERDFRRPQAPSHALNIRTLDEADVRH
jgi:hypothetical protein